MSSDRQCSAKMTNWIVPAVWYKGNTLNNFCGNRCGKEPSVCRQRWQTRPGRLPSPAAPVAPNYLSFLWFEGGFPATELRMLANRDLLSPQRNLHRFGAFCSVKVTGKGICISVNARRSMRDFQASRAVTAVTPLIDSLHSQVYSGCDQRHWRQAEVLQ
jgi:hypothetical protein